MVPPSPCVPGLVIGVVREAVKATNQARGLKEEATVAVEHLVQAQAACSGMVR
jgi:hypothetical protein